MKLLLTIEVEYDENGIDENTLTDMLYAVANNASANAGFTGDTPATTYAWNPQVKRVEGSRWWFVCTDDFAMQEYTMLEADNREDALAEALSSGVEGKGFVTDENPDSQTDDDR